MNGILQRTLLILSCGCSATLAVWGQSVPILSLTKQSTLQISVQGLPGSNYQLQYASNLNGAIWNPLTNFTVGSGPVTITDHAAISNQIRFYRALLLNAGNNSYAPEELAGGELFQFQTPSVFPAPTANDYLAVNSSTSALWVRQFPQLGANPIVAIYYQRSGAFSAQLQSIEPATVSQPFSRTNFYSLYFTSPNGGFYQVTDGMVSSQTGLFTINRSLVGQQIAPAAITPGQVFKFGETNLAAANIVIDSTTNGVIARLLGNSELLTSVGLHYEKLGPLAYQLDAVFPGAPITNRYWGIYQSTAAGVFSDLLNSGGAIFSREDVATGGPLAPLQLEAGEIYHLPSAFSNPQTDITRLLVNSTTNGLLLTLPPQLATSAITPVDFYYKAAGPLHGELDVVSPPSLNNPSGQTNRCTLVYTATNSGLYRITSLAVNQTGTFVRDQSLVGQNVASPTLAAGEVYSFQATNISTAGGALIVLHSPTNASVSWFPSTSSLDAGIFPATVQYTRLGPLGARVEIVTSSIGPNPQPLTNICYLAYLSTNSGFSQGLINQVFSPSGLGSFVRNLALIGQQIAPPQLTPGERYEMIFSDLPGNPLNVVTLLATSPTNGFAFWETPNVFSFTSGGLTPVTLNYLSPGPRESELEIIFPATALTPQAQTNFCTLVYSATDSGVIQVSGTPQPTGGLFRRNSTLIGQQPAPFQLTSGESFQITTSNLTSTVTDTLLLDSSTTGILFAQGTGPGMGVFPNITLHYQRTSDFSAQLDAVIQPTPPIVELRTNSYSLIYTGTNTGLTKRSTGPVEATYGRFQRQATQ